MKRTSIAGCVIVGLICLLPAPGVSFAAGHEAADGKKATIARGQYLVMLGGCNDCHSPKKMTPTGPALDEQRLLSGHVAGEKIPEAPMNIIGPDKWGAVTNNNLTAWVGPWGTSYAVNLTPDRETGTGTWNEDFFIKILRTGKFMGSGRGILPPMPWYDYAKLTDADLKAIFAYFMSLRPINNLVPAAVLAPPPQR